MQKVVQTKSCKQCNVFFDITDKDLEFYEKISPIFWWKKYSIPTPSLCPECRQQRRSVYRNERSLYKRKCDATKKDIISIYHPNTDSVVYEQSFWWSDKWDAMEYEKDFDFTRWFFAQFQELVQVVPKMSLSVETQENCEYTNYCWWNKDCYYLFLTSGAERCYYSVFLRDSKNTIDCSHCQWIHWCYELIDSHNCSQCYFSQFLQDCSYCLFCFDLKSGQYRILNKQVSKQEFEKTRKSLKDSKILSDYIPQYEELRNTIPRKQNYNIGSENIGGEYIVNSNNIIQGFQVSNCKDCKYVDLLLNSHTCMDVYDWWETAEHCYECYKVGNGVSHTLFSAFCITNVRNLIYCYDCVNNTHDCFGCVGLKNKSYCILNKQYTKQEYEELVPQLIEHMQKSWQWGEFFLGSMSPFGYNETIAQEYFPLTKQEATKQWFNWSDYEIPFPKVDKIIPANKLPNDIEDIPDDILNWAIECETTKKPFKIITQELEFYRKHHLPIPRKHPDQRHKERMQLRNPRKLFDRTCDKCSIEIETSYSPEKTEMVYCEKCYNNQIY